MLERIFPQNCEGGEKIKLMGNCKRYNKHASPEDLVLVVSDEGFYLLRCESSVY